MIKKPSRRKKKPFLLSLRADLRIELDALISKKKRVELFSRTECNLQTECETAIQRFLISEAERLKTVKKPTRIL